MDQSVKIKIDENKMNMKSYREKLIELRRSL